MSPAGVLKCVNQTLFLGEIPQTPSSPKERRDNFFRTLPSPCALSASKRKASLRGSAGAIRLARLLRRLLSFYFRILTPIYLFATNLSRCSTRKKFTRKILSNGVSHANKD